MHILYLHQYFSTPKGSAGTRSYEFAKALLRRGHQVTMLCGSTQGCVTGLHQPFSHFMRRGVVEGIDVVEFHISYSNHDGLLKRAFKFFKFVCYVVGFVLLKPKYDLIYATSTPLTVAIPAICAKLLRRKKFIFEVRDLWPELPKAMAVIKNPLILWGMGVLERLAYYFADFGVALSPAICDGMTRFGSLKKERVAFIPNGSDVDFFQHHDDESMTLLPKGLHDLLANKFTAVFSGAHGLANGLDAVIDAAKYLQDHGHVEQIAFIFIGNGKIKPKLLERVRAGNIKNCYFFDPVPKVALRWVLQRAGIGLMILSNIPAFYYGTSPNKFFDYIASGLPVFNNYPGWLSELITAKKCGVIVPPSDARAFAEALYSYSCLSDNECGLYRKQALLLAQEEFDRVILSKKFVAVCEKVYGEKSF